MWGEGVSVQVKGDTCADAPERRQSVRAQIHRNMYRFIHIHIHAYLYMCTDIFINVHVHRSAWAPSSAPRRAF